ncbi:MAG: hypothetical protein K6U11_11950 [bacterium]|nr:hypothetical protein [bacterium]
MLDGVRAMGVRAIRSIFFNFNHRLLILVAMMAAVGVVIIQASCPFCPPTDLLVRDAEGAEVASGWEIQYPLMNANWINDIWGSSSSDIFAVGFGLNAAVIGHYDGQRWKTIASYLLEEESGELTAIWGSSASDIFAVGGTSGQSDGRPIILHFDGRGWSLMDSAFSGCLLDVWGTGPSDVFAVGLEGLILHWSGSAWSKMSLNQALEPSDPLPDLQSIWGRGPDDLFAVGIRVKGITQEPSSVILHYQHGQWSLMKEIPSVCLYDIWAAEGGDIWAVGERIFCCRNGLWQDVTPSDLPEGFCLNKIAGRSANDIIAVGVADLAGEEGLILRYDGQAWTRVKEVNTCGYLRSVRVDPNNGQVMVVGGNFLYDYPSRGIVLIYDGASWSSQSAKGYEGTCFQIWANSSQAAWVVGGHPNPATEEEARVFIARYDGQVWSPIDLPEYGILSDIWGSLSGELFAVGGDWWEDDSGQLVIEAQILHSSDGIHWSRMPDAQNIKDFLEGVWGSSPSNVYAVGEGVYHYNGSRWSKMTTPSAGRLRGIWGSDSRTIFTVGDWSESGGGRATILRYDGQSWRAMSHNIQDNLLKVWCSSASNVFAISESQIYHYDGSGWSAMSCPQTAGYYDLWGVSANEVFVTYDRAVEQENGPIHYQCGLLFYDGQSWIDLGSVPAYGPLWGIGGTSARNLFLASDLGTILHLGKQETAVSQQKIPLQPGWNLISFQVNVCIFNKKQPPAEIWFPPGIEFRQGADLCTFLSDNQNSPIRDAANPQQAGDWQRITSFDRNGAHLLDKSVPAFVNNLTYLAAGYGYWIKMNKPGYLLLSGPMLSSKTSIHLEEGWNLIGAPCPDSCYYQQDSPPLCPMQDVPVINFIPMSGPLIEALFSSISGKYLRVSSFDCQGAKLYDPKAPAFVCNLRYFAPGYGYWIKMFAAADLILPSATLP